MTEEKFYYLMSTPPSELSPEELMESKQFREEFQSAYDSVLAQLFEKQEGTEDAHKQTP